MNVFVLVLSSQLLYYLLIAQTGVVGVFHSHIQDLFTLPIGGIVGGVLSAIRSHGKIKTELYLLFALQIALSWFYPHYTLEMLFALGFLVGYTTPLLLYAFGTQSRFQLAVGLAIAYGIGTAFYTDPFAQRGEIALVLPLISIVALFLSRLDLSTESEKKKLDAWTLGIMMLWIFVDSALFETLSRSDTMDIWSRFTALIVVSHLFGVYLAFRYGKELMLRTPIIWGLFAISYVLYWTHQPLLLAIVYPIVISYYNVLLFQTLIGFGDIRRIAYSTVAIGWGAASLANGVALSHQLWIAAAVLAVFGMIYSYQRRKI